MRWFPGVGWTLGLAALMVAGGGLFAAGRNSGTQNKAYSLDTTMGLEFINANGEIVEYRGKRARRTRTLTDWRRSGRLRLCG